MGDGATVVSFFLVLVLMVIGGSFFLWLIPLQLWIAAWSSGAYVGLDDAGGHAPAARDAHRHRQPTHHRDEGGARHLDRSAGVALPRGRQRDARGQRADQRRQGGHQAAVQAGRRHRPGRTRRVRGGADERQSARHHHAQDLGRGQGRHSARGDRAHHGALQHQPPGGRRHRGDRASRASARASCPPSALRAPTRRCSRIPTASRRTCSAAGLDSGTAFEILSIDIADIDVGANIGAKLQTEKAEADKQVAQAHAESRRAIAVAAEQEMRARVEEMRAKLVESEAQIPMAMAEALAHAGASACSTTTRCATWPPTPRCGSRSASSTIRGPSDLAEDAIQRTGPSPLLGPHVSKREFVLRLVLAEVIARPGEGPLAPRFEGICFVLAGRADTDTGHAPRSRSPTEQSSLELPAREGLGQRTQVSS